MFQGCFRSNINIVVQRRSLYEGLREYCHLSRTYVGSNIISRSFGTSNDMITINWSDKNKNIIATKARIGTTLLQAAHANSIDMEGACEGVCACSTCHVILEPDVYDQLPPPSENEEDMLDQAFGLKATSRLGCQVILEENLDGILVQLPAATRNFYVVRLLIKQH